MFARHLDVGQEIHLDGLVTIAATCLAATALHVEREAAGLVAADLGLGQVDEERADIGEDARVGGGIGARRAADGALVDVDHLVDIFQPLDAVVGHGALQRVVEVVREDGLERLVDERGLAGAGDSRDENQLSQRELHVDVLEVVARAASQSDFVYS